MKDKNGLIKKKKTNSKHNKERKSRESMWAAKKTDRKKIEGERKKE